jgi:dolichyl-phosphate beta-glucosyltransferase
VRAGLRHASGLDPQWVGYLDADMATPPGEVLRLLDIASGDPSLAVVIGARVALLGRDIRRSPFRHYTGRVFATLASSVLKAPVYDTQCGAKLLRAGAPLDQALASPFRSRWAFDVELLGRLDRAGIDASMYWEEPLRSWNDVAGSRRALRSSIRATLDLVGIRRDLARWEPR